MMEPTKDDLEAMRGLNLGAMLDMLQTESYGGDIEIRQLLPPIICADGTKLSVQASQHHYSTPRSNKGPYTHVEVGFPSREVPHAWLEYAEDKTKPLNTVYAHIPLELVHFYIAAHGGINYDKTLRIHHPKG